MDDPAREVLRVVVLGDGEAARTEYTGTRALMLAVLQDGIASYMSEDARRRAEAEYWVGAATQRSPFAFNVICETFGLEPDAVRAALQKLRAEKLGSSSRQRSRPNVRGAARIGRR
jgi:hypothetical protein